MSNKVFGYEWEDIKRAQQREQTLSRQILGPIKFPDVTDEDRELLSAHGAEGLRRMGFNGVIDRLARAGLIEP